MFDLVRYSNFIVANRLTQSQFFLLYSIYHAKKGVKESKEAIEALKKYKQAFPTGDNYIIGKTFTNDLLIRGFLIKLNEDGTINSYQLGKPFMNSFVDAIQATEEIFEVYPGFIQSNAGVKYPLTLVDRIDIQKTYWKAIKGSQEEHEEVIKDIKYAVANDLPFGKLSTFIASQNWLNIRKVRIDPSTLSKNVAVGFEENDL
jgi:hypothetical protein